MGAADHQAMLRRRGKEHSYISITPGAWSSTTNVVAADSEVATTVYGVYQGQREAAQSGLAFVEGDEVLLIDASPLLAASKTPKSGDALVTGSVRRAVIGVAPKRGTDSTIWAYQLLLRGSIDAG
ncbi:MAG TPA: hypothetical protein VGB13_00395 [Candidatus Krumholzibacteria bacterium]